jgi:hypothetical protein
VVAVGEPRPGRTWWAVWLTIFLLAATCVSAEPMTLAATTAHFSQHLPAEVVTAHDGQAEIHAKPARQSCLAGGRQPGHEHQPIGHDATVPGGCPLRLAALSVLALLQRQKSSPRQDPNRATARLGPA